MTAELPGFRIARIAIGSGMTNAQSSASTERNKSLSFSVKLAARPRTKLAMPQMTPR
jgi:hypothetical protein